MARFNLIDEPWIMVIDENNTNAMVSIKEIFKNASRYKSLAGDMKTQDFAVFRVLLSILHTVYSRFDFNGNVYENIQLDENFKPINELDDEDEIDEYKEALICTWQSLWINKGFTESVENYLEKWHDRFYLFDDKYPFFQVKISDIQGKTNKSLNETLGKTINRLISESGNKVAIFSPKSNKKKGQLSSSDVARWLLVYQGYTGLSDKIIFGEEKYKASKGWLFDIGGIMLEGNNLFETFMLNLVLVHPVLDTKMQKPCWEYENLDLITNYLKEKEIDNLSELYTNWSRAVYIKSNFDESEDFKLSGVKLPEISHENNFLECMTLLKYDEKENIYRPMKHKLYKSLWRNYGLIISDNNSIGIIKWIYGIKDKIDDIKIRISAISMQDDGNATSWLPTDEIHDKINIEESILIDKNKYGWIIRINEIVEFTKEILDKNYRMFVSDIKEIRNIQSKEFINTEIEKLYAIIDTPFKKWISNLKNEDNIEEKMNEWKYILKNIVEKHINTFLENSSIRDYKGIEKNGKVKNIITSYNQFMKILLKKCNIQRKEEIVNE